MADEKAQLCVCWNVYLNQEPRLFALCRLWLGEVVLELHLPSRLKEMGTKNNGSGVLGNCLNGVEFVPCGLG